jgi:hypothetical protein
MPENQCGKNRRRDAWHLRRNRRQPAMIDRKIVSERIL